MILRRLRREKRKQIILSRTSSGILSGVEKYSLRIKKSAIKDLEAIGTKADRVRVINRIHALADDPRPRGSRKLSAREHYRVRQGRYRILYTIVDRELTVHVIEIADRKEIYRNR